MSQHTLLGTRFVKTLSLIQPWACLSACGAKKIETRSWQTRYRGPIAIHAGKSRKYQDLQRIELVRSLGADPYVMKYNHRKDDLTLNALARWCNRPQIRESIPFSEYTRRKETVIINQ